MGEPPIDSRLLFKLSLDSFFATSDSISLVEKSIAVESNSLICDSFSDCEVSLVSFFYLIRIACPAKKAIRGHIRIPAQQVWLLGLKKSYGHL